MKLNIPKIEKQIPKNPDPNEKRSLEKFAFLPKRIDNTTVVWLEKYISVERYNEYDFICEGGGARGYKWQEVKRKVLN